ncbi:unnamed protein product [Prunus armeniaca]
MVANPLCNSIELQFLPTTATPFYPRVMLIWTPSSSASPTARIGPRKFSYSKLARAMSNFKEGEKLGEGGFGGVYEGFIPDLQSYVAVKRISSGSKQGSKEYTSEVKIISRLRHRNLVQLNWVVP